MVYTRPTGEGESPKGGQMAAQLQTLTTLTGDAEFTAPLSPAISLDVVTGYDAEGWAEWLTVNVGMRLVSRSGRMYKVIGFTTASTIICTQSGLDIDPAVKFVELTGEGLEWADKPVYDYVYASGLVSMGA